VASNPFVSETFSKRNRVCTGAHQLSSKNAFQRCIFRIFKRRRRRRRRRKKAISCFYFCFFPFPSLSVFIFVWVSAAFDAFNLYRNDAALWGNWWRFCYLNSTRYFNPAIGSEMNFRVIKTNWLQQQQSINDQMQRFPPFRFLLFLKKYFCFYLSYLVCRRLVVCYSSPSFACSWDRNCGFTWAVTLKTARTGVETNTSDVRLHSANWWNLHQFIRIHTRGNGWYVGHSNYTEKVQVI